MTEGYLRLFEAIMGQAYEDASYEADKDKSSSPKRKAEKIALKNEATAFIDRMKKDFANY